MMLNLAYPINDTVVIDAEIYEINLAYDNVLRLFDMLHDEELTDVEQIEIGLEMLLGRSLDLDLAKQEEVFFEIFKSTISKDADDNAPVDIDGNPMPVMDKEKDDKKIYSIKQDAEYIFASFYQDYGIDLLEAQGKLHWYKFQALLAGLRQDTKFKEVIEIRTMELPTGKGTGKHRKQVEEAKKAYRLKPE
ncbi:Gp15 family bacteriophage protein [Oceanobacillus sp. CFH 90083]|uniref:Gp15 family bacteriophage protein n=1 Tax=Oceanobacillus sp. CFH 90083 TaxID=2592336 RepID=UPI001D14689B|nr:Gp15 family bacteriophage protein [Oceanobacillus sp. CFH 90083]